MAQGIVIASSLLLARLYAPEAFGVFAIYSAIYSVLSIFVTLQYETTLYLPRRHRQAMCTLVFILLYCPVTALAIGVPIILFRDTFASLTGTPHLVTWVWFLPFSMMLAGWYQALRFWTMRLEAFTDVARNTFTRALVGAGAAIVMGFWPPFPAAPEAGLVLSQIIGEMVGNLLLVYRIGRRDRSLLFWPGWRRIWIAALRWRHLALSLTASQGIGRCFGHVPVLAIGWLFGPAAAGLYAWADRFTVLPATLISAAIGDVYRQRATVDFHRHGRFDKLMRRTLALTTALAIPPYVIGIMIAPFLFSWLFGATWEEAGVIAQILMVGGLVSFATSPVDEATLIHQKTRYIFFLQLSRLLLKLVAVGCVMIFDGSLYTLIWLIVVNRIFIYLIDLSYCYYLARGSQINPRCSSV